MKAVTISKIARISIAIAVVLIIAIPAYGGIQSMKLDTSGNFVETESVYELDNMTASNVESNITTAMGDSSGFKLVYGNKIVNVDKTNLSAVANEVKASGESVAILLDSNGDIAKQQTIIGSSNTTMFVYMGLKLSKSLTNTINPNVSINARTDSGIHKISDIEFTSTDNYYNIKVGIPMAVIAAAAALNANMNLDVGIEYNKFFTVNVAVELPMSSLGIPETIQDLKIEHVGDGGAGQKISLTAGLGVDDTIEGTIGDVKLHVGKDGKIWAACETSDIISSLQKQLDTDGQLTVKIDGQDPVVIDKEVAQSLINMANEIIGGLVA